MIKFTVGGIDVRPKRLSEDTRLWAWESMHGKYGTEAMNYDAVKMDDVEEFEKLSTLDKYDLTIKTIAQKAPVRVCEKELVSGSATLGRAVFHVTPATFKGETFFGSTSHLTVDFETTLKFGIDYYEEKINEKLTEKLTDIQRRFLKSLLGVIESMRIYHARYLQAVKEVKPQIYENLLQVPFKPARNFYEAVQSVWFTFSFIRLMGNWPGIGRIDYLLGDYLKKDLSDGKITLDFAREILASFFIKGCEWITEDTPLSSGDAQHYQNIVLAGIDENGKEITNEVTFLVLDIIEELGISDFPITVRINDKTSKKLLDKIAKVIRYGGGVVAVYNEPLILNALIKYGYPVKEARKFANDGCWEVQVPGKTQFHYHAFDGLALLQKQTLKGYEKVHFDTFEELYSAYVSDLQATVNDIFMSRISGYPNAEVKAKDLNANEENPTSVVSLFENGCIEKARSYANNGAIYNVISPHLGGLSDVVNCLYAIKKLVFEEKKISFDEFMVILKNNWQGYEPLRTYVNSNYVFYGNDSDEVDGIAVKLLHDFYLCCKNTDVDDEYFFPAGISTFGREINWRYDRLATAEGFFAGQILAGNASPTPGTDIEGATAVIKSYSKADLTEMVTGTALDIKLHPSSVRGKNGITAIRSLIEGFCSEGGFFMQLDVISAEVLRKAQENPKEYKTLSVRVSGWNARFITLTKEWQDMIINRTEHGR